MTKRKDNLRILTLDEVRNVELLEDYLWLQTTDEPDAVYHLQVFGYSGDLFGEGDTLRETWIDFNTPGETATFLLQEYGLTWRCWSECPTDEQRLETEWDKGSE